MLRRTAMILFIIAALVTASEPLSAVHGIVMTKAELLALDSADKANEAQGTDKRQGNGFLRALSAPFKAIGRLFGGKKKNDNKLHRLSENDVKKFERAKMVRVVDATLTPTQEPSSNNPSESVSPGQLTVIDAKSAEANEHLEKGRTLLNGGQLNEAIGELSRAVALNSALSDALNLLGVAYESKGLRDLAFDSFEVALRGENDNPEHFNNLGYLYFKNGDYNEAAKYLKRAVRLAPNQQRYLNNLGLVQVQRKNFDDAYKCFAQAMGEFEGHMNVANRLQSLGYDKEAIKHLEAARAIKPNVALILLRLANLYSRTGRTDQAEQARKSLADLQTLASTPR